MNPNALPVSLRARPQWVCWTARTRDGKRTKVPLDPATGAFASTADPGTWGTFDDALGRATHADVAGIGFVFTSEDPYVGVDLDGCRDPETGALDDEAVQIVTRLHSYTEVSPSGTGVHVIARGDLPDGPRRRGSVEMYDEGRFFTMTGERVQATPERVRDRHGPIRAVHRTHVAASTPESEPGAASEGDPRETSDPPTAPDRDLPFAPRLDDDQVLEKARSAANGEKFTSLWSGTIGGHDSHSEADMALCCLLAFWTDGDPARVDRLFRRSGLLRPKWDEVHYADGATYGERTVERACARVSDRYSDPPSG